MIEAGHTDALEYGWTFFNVALKGMHKRNNENVYNLAVAVRIGRFADKTEWRKFTRKMASKD